jgi:hypothetical protein
MRPRHAITLLGLALAVELIAAFPAFASCVAPTEADAVAKADVIFEGVAQPGDLRADGTLQTPARFSVLKYLKGDGPNVVSVADARGVDAMRIQSGEYWVIYGRGSAGGVIPTSPCFGSYLGNGPKPFASPAATPSASPSPDIAVGPGLAASAEVGWGVKAGAGIAGLALVIVIGYGVARIVVGTT